MKRIREQMSPALVISVIALFVALGGGAYAALGVNSVGPKQLKRNAVTTPKLKNGAVTPLKIKKQAVRTAKLATEAVTAPKIAGGSVIESKLGDNAVTESKIADGSVSEAKLAGGLLGQAVAYAEVKPDGTVVEANSRGIANSNIETYGTAIYCLSGLPDFGTISVTPGMGLTEFDGIVSVNADKAPFDEGICSPFPTAQVAVVTYYDDFFGSIAPVQSKKPFTIALFK